MKASLKYLNSIPLPLTIKHYQVFGDTTPSLKEQGLTNKEAWDTLRESHPFFSVSANREEWLAASEIEVTKDGQDTRLKDRADDIVALFNRKSISRIFSVGVGGAALEYQIKKRMPAARLTCSDYSPVTIEKLKKVFLESDELVLFDALSGNWGEVREKYIGQSGVCLMYRLDAGFNDEEWKKIFRLLHEAGISRILFIPTGVLSILSIYNRKRRELVWFLKGVSTVFSGYLRTKKRFRQFWSPYYIEEEMLLGGLKAFYLSIRG